MRASEFFCLTVAISVVASLTACTSGPGGDGGRAALDSKKAEALDTFHQLWPDLVAAGDHGAPAPTAKEMREQCADDGSTLAYSVNGWVNNATATTHADVVQSLAAILTQHGWTRQEPQSDNQALRFTKSDAFVALFANPNQGASPGHNATPGHYAVVVRSTCAEVSDEFRHIELPAETVT